MAPGASAEPTAPAPAADALRREEAPRAAAAAHTAHAPHHLFAPVPRASLRELAPDRPDTTESPVTVDAGHFQAELEALSVGRDQGTTELTLGVVNAKAGLSPWADLQVIVDGWHHADATGGIGDLTLRCKLNVWGNDGGGSAFGLMPFVRLPGGDAGVQDVEGGLIIPFELRLPADWSFGTMLELDVVSRPDGYGLDALVSATTSHPLVGELAGYLELESTLAVDQREPAELGANTGLVLDVSDDVALDTGVRVGVTAAAPDFVAFAGGTARY